MAQKPMERGENGRKHVIKNAGQNTFKTDEEDVLENATVGKHDNDQTKWCKIPWKMEETGANARNKP